MATLFVDKIDPQSGTALEIGSSGDTITIPSGATITNNGTQTGFGGANTPAFFAYDTSAQSLSDNVNTKADLATEVLDTDGNFASNRFTPTTAGKYFLFGKTVAGASTYNKNRNSGVSIYKNGSQIDYTETFFTPYGNTTGGTTIAPFISAIIDMNGSSDYVELYVQVNSLDGSNISCEKTVFGGYKIIT
jgi:hypothetical protein